MSIFTSKQSTANQGKCKMTKINKLVAAAMLASLFAAPAFAQEKPDRIVLESKVGSVMTSTGGDYQSADVGKLLIRDQSMMLADGSKATVVYYYDNDKRKCTENYAGPNTFVIDDSCKAAAWIPHTGASAAVIIGTGIVIGLLLEGMGDEPVGPLSTGPNGTIKHL